MATASRRGRIFAPVPPAAEERGFRSSRRGERWNPLALLLAAAVLVGCDAAAARRPGGEPGRGPDRVSARRVISLVPSATELIVALDRADRLVARTGHDGDPRIAHLPSLGRTTAASTEAVLAHEPDLVLVMDEPNARPLARELAALGVRVEVVGPGRLADVPRAARALGAMLGAGARADSLAAAFSDGIARVRERYAAAPSDRPTVFYLLWHDPPWTAGAGTFIGDLIDIAGGRHAFPELSGGWPRLSLEALIRRDPDFLVVPRGTLPGKAECWLRAAPGWRELSAVRTGRVAVVDPDLFNRPGPRLVEAAERLARALHAKGRARSGGSGRGCGS